jgi:hypothetical protein
MVRELDTVVLTHDVPDAGLAAGDVGAVVHRHRDGAYDVEFVTGSGRTVAMLTLGGRDIRDLAPSEILHARPLP